MTRSVVSRTTCCTITIQGNSPKTVWVSIKYCYIKRRWLRGRTLINVRGNGIKTKYTFISSGHPYTCSPVDRNFSFSATKFCFFGSFILWPGVQRQWFVCGILDHWRRWRFGRIKYLWYLWRSWFFLWLKHRRWLVWLLIIRQGRFATNLCWVSTIFWIAGFANSAKFKPSHYNSSIEGNPSPYDVWLLRSRLVLFSSNLFP